MGHAVDFGGDARGECLGPFCLVKEAHDLLQQPFFFPEVHRIQLLQGRQVVIEAEEGPLGLHLLPFLGGEGCANDFIERFERPLAAACTGCPVDEVGVSKIHGRRPKGEAAAQRLHQPAIPVEAGYRKGKPE